MVMHRNTGAVLLRNVDPKEWLTDGNAERQQFLKCSVQVKGHIYFIVSD